MNTFAAGHGYVASTFQMTFVPPYIPPGLMNKLQSWGSDKPMSYLTNCSATTNSIVLGGPCD